MHADPQAAGSAAASAVADFLRGLERGEYALEAAHCFCGSLDGGFVATHDRYGIPHPMRLCARCGLIYAAIRLDGPSLARFYEGDYRRIYGDTGTVPFRCSLEYTSLAAYLRHFDILPTSVIELGCGNGEILEELAEEFGCPVTGVELDIDQAEQARARGITVTDELGLGEVPQAGLVVMHHYLEHVRDLRAELARAAELLLPGGFLYVSLPGFFLWERPALWQNAHLWQFTGETLTAVMNACGFELFAFDEHITSLWRYTGQFRESGARPHVVEELVKFINTGAVPRLSSLGKFPTRQRRENTRTNLRRAPQLEKLVNTESGRCIIVGAGPSADLCPVEPDCPVVVIDRMNGWAIDRGMAPDYVVAMDSSPNVAESFARCAPFARHIVASSCDPAVLDALLGRRVYLYQTPQHDFDLAALLDEAKVERASMVMAGGTVVQAALSVAVALGFRDFELYGVDLHVGEGTYAAGAADNGHEGARIDVVIDGRRFVTTPAYFTFAQDFFSWLARARRDGVCDRVRVHGDSLLSAMSVEDIRG